MLNKIRLSIIKKLLKETDGYTFTGFNEGQPIKFYYCEDNDTYYLGKRIRNMYYGRVMLNGWSFEMSRHLPWGEMVDGYKYLSEPKEVDFQHWLYGISENVYREFNRYKKGKEVTPSKKYEDEGYFDCPNCERLIYCSDDLESHKYCLNCGVKLKWEEVVYE